MFTCSIFGVKEKNEAGAYGKKRMINSLLRVLNIYKNIAIRGTSINPKLSVSKLAIIQDTHPLPGRVS